MKKVIFYTTCCLFALIFISCSENDHNNDMVGPNGTSDSGITDEEVAGGFIPLANEDLGILFPVTTITTESGLSTFNYQNGKMVRGTSRDGVYSRRNFDFQIKENPLQIDITLYDEENESSEIKICYTDIKTNKYGFITEAKYTESQPYGSTILGKLKVAYDSKGYITKRENYEQIGDEYNLLTMNFVWISGNLKQITSYFEEKNNYEGDLYEYQYESDTYTLEYDSNNSQYSNSGIYYWNDIIEDDITFDFMWYSGLFGKTTKNIPTGIKDKYNFKDVIDGEVSFTDEGEDNYDIRTFYNQNGSISSIRYSNGVNEDAEDEEDAYQKTYYYSYN